MREADERRADERMVLGVFNALTARSGAPLQYALMTDTPVGPIGLARGEGGLCRLDFTRDEDAFLTRLLDRFGDRPLLRQPAKLDAVRRQLDRYFSGRSLRFEVDVDLSAISGFSRRILEATARIPAGRVLTYTEVAAKAGSPRASRAAGNALHNNPVAIIVPCHRIVASSGLGGYGGGIENKKWLLRHEGVAT